MQILGGHRHFWNKRNRHSLYLGLLLLGLSLLIQVGAGRYSLRHATESSFVGDLFLDNLPVVNLNWLIVQGAVVLWVGTALFLVFRPEYSLFGLKAVALFIITRSFFISLTHIGIYPQTVPLMQHGVGSGLYNLLTFQGNYFFSGHTGLPFLMALIFWTDKPWRYFFFGVSLVFGVSVLLAHVHYSIDVFAAPFLAYGIYKIATKLFLTDYALMPARHI